MRSSKLLGQYRITGSIGMGGMGAVYSAEHTLLGRVAAIKILQPELSRNQEMVNRFFNEARAAAAIRHPSIVEIYDFGWDTDGSAYIVMEHLQGESLAARLGRGRMSVTGVKTIVRQIAGALVAAHRSGIVHRDLKPENVFLVPDPEVSGGERIKLLDFGIAKLAADLDGYQHQQQKTRPGAIMGTPTYMAPEQCRGVTVDHRADLYSLGCIMFELCTGRAPFVGDGMGDVLAAHIHVAPPAVSSLVSDIPLHLELLVKQLLVKDLAKRIQSAEAVVEALDAVTGAASRTSQVVIGKPATGAFPRALPTTLSAATGARVTRPSRARKKPKRVVGIVAAVCVVAVAGVAGRLWLDRGSPSEVTPAGLPGPPPGPTAAVVAPRAPDGAFTDEVAAAPPNVGDEPARAPRAANPPLPAGAGTPRNGSTDARAPGEPPRPGEDVPSAGTPALPASGPPQTTAASVAKLYTDVGQQLKELDRDQGFRATTDLWPLFRRIRINDSLTDPVKRNEATVALRRLHDQIVARSR